MTYTVNANDRLVPTVQAVGSDKLKQIRIGGITVVKKTDGSLDAWRSVKTGNADTVSLSVRELDCLLKIVSAALEFSSSENHESRLEAWLEGYSDALRKTHLDESLDQFPPRK
ncbi:hypothetical protein AA0242T_1362 [Acetobacter aceti NRIC 0242]|uniref:Uncharacterized protein n=1 Tax=Acetobacter aceti NBRC 14818 TaxID=887700 RepID=A0AB33IJ03_ACEAC|nr:hypothetical protein [Acetobacter aceti]TCS31773.1 hypothetical protein EDC15_1155 [Acetobacter aceti NBRC 14818]BCK77192.1 hypothetical protein EMQ_2798 [Acetobacter aceti NBRC 14818]GAN58872.1 hypothetical protein Abac_088_003 [Acetobacter aceti NBRC 14818]GBO80660.1 hypothetical protein AA0242T_1362 [Acetobacter aceti NRIC 0242]